MHLDFFSRPDAPILGPNGKPTLEEAPYERAHHIGRLTMADYDPLWAVCLDLLRERLWWHESSWLSPEEAREPLTLLGALPRATPDFNCFLLIWSPCSKASFQANGS